MTTVAYGRIINQSINQFVLCSATQREAADRWGDHFCSQQIADCRFVAITLRQKGRSRLEERFCYGRLGRHRQQIHPSVVPCCPHRHAQYLRRFSAFGSREPSNYVQSFGRPSTNPGGECFAPVLRSGKKFWKP